MSNGMGDLPDEIFGSSGNRDEKLDEINKIADTFKTNNNQGRQGQNISGISAMDNLLQSYKNDKNINKPKAEMPTKFIEKKKEVKPRIDPHTLALELFGAYQQNKKADEDFENMLRNRQILPVAQQIAEMILKGVDWIILKNEVLKKFPDQEIIKDAVILLKSLPETDLLLSGLAIYPILYGSGGCEKCREFIRKNKIQIHIVVPISNCNDCKNKNMLGTCSFFGARLFDATVDDDIVDSVINDFVVRGRLTASQCQNLKANPSAPDRLKTALQLAHAHSPKKPSDWTRVSPKPKKDPLAMSYLEKETAVKQAIDDISSGKTDTEVKATLSTRHKDAAEIVRDAIARLRIVSADSLDSCQNEKYVFAIGLELIRGDKCDECKYASAVCCNRHDVVFTEANMALPGLNDESPEAREILSYFYDSNFDINIKPEVNKPMLEIQLDNPGIDLVVDVGKKDTLGKNIDVGTIFQDIPEMRVDILPSPQNEDNLEISGLAGNEGFDLTDMF